MSTRAMKALLVALGKEAAKTVRRPADPETVMHEFCRAMSVRRGKPVQLLFRAFPSDIPVSGMRLDCGERSLVVVDEGTVPEAQLVILGHELWHEEQGDHGHGHGLPAAGRTLGTGHDVPRAVQRAAEAVLAAEEVPREALHVVAARSASTDEHEVDAETFGLLFGREVRTWMTGRHAEGPVTMTTVEGRINRSLINRRGRLL
ncbi:toxin [Streptomyces sp. NPDC059578]|uniref:toxin n=1 Tax=Streptomyces sp. NPDC059578 TaxID=3346874 RepID=UPI0036B578B4